MKMTAAQVEIHNSRVEQGRRRKAGQLTSEGDQELQRAAVNTGEEEELHNEIIKECRRRGWLYLHGSMAHRTRRTVGEPDFIIFADNARVFVIECKTRTGKMSAEQEQFRAHLRKMGRPMFIVRSIQEFIVTVDSK